MTHTQNRNECGVESAKQTISPTQMFSTFSQKRRQLVLAYLAQRAAAISLGDVAEYIALQEGQPTREQYQRILTDLYHCHLPQMTGGGLVCYDAERELVELEVDVDELTPYLRLAAQAPAL